MQITILLVWHERTAIYIYSGSSTILWFMHIKTQNFIITITFFDYVTRMQFKLKTHLFALQVIFGRFLRILSWDMHLVLTEHLTYIELFLFCNMHTLHCLWTMFGHGHEHQHCTGTHSQPSMNKFLLFHDRASPVNAKITNTVIMVMKQ